MLTVMVLVNAMCLVAAILLLVQIWRPRAAVDEPADFSSVLATVRPAGTDETAPGGHAARPDGLPIQAAPPAAVEEPGELALTELPVSDRLAMVRYMLEGKTVTETAAAARVAPAVVRALYRLHGRHEAEPCLRPLS